MPTAACPFPDHTLDSAPPAARRVLEAVAKKQGGHLPSAVARLASSPELLTGFLQASAAFESSTLDPLAREVVVMTMATRHACHVCVAMHTARLTALDAGPELVAALRSPEPRVLPDERLEGVRRFTLAVIASSGAVDDATLQDFLALGHTPRNALEVVLGIGTYTLSTLANRMTGAPVDGPSASFA
ncbi:carboxymuconolactone decarboxylase family protein [Streptomyces sp. NBC_01754]|uniref:carboxymuconolactone decarboxylase family protein n=1 Tax=Streptomyces sp. NBC_01754 TaxID=2975930 RepID=UPI002DD8582A|nr:carboxymuconolactone decarboxylase family protein [Streptomyces sp. NBC_01754]WSC92124.1 carboxymuconolactone decarboxylase family protein [Streptomyces sp. NBC_01754]